MTPFLLSDAMISRINGKVNSAYLFSDEEEIAISDEMYPMDRISELPDTLLLRVLALLPTAKDIVGTMVLSKRWQFLWLSVPRLVFDDQEIEYGKFSRFVDRYLIVNEVPELETLHFKISTTCAAQDIKVWMRAANNFDEGEMIIEIDSSSCASPIILPKFFYTECTMLVTLKLNNVILADFSSLMFFPSLKTLSLLSVKYPDEEFFSGLLTYCYALESLEVEKCRDDNVSVFTVRVPYLKKLVLHTSENRDRDDSDGFVINTPCLEYFNIVDHKGGFCVIENNMPNVVEAYVDVTHSHPRMILSYITSVKRLYLCLSTSKDLYPVDTFFHRLEHLTLCTCETEWLNLLLSMLRDAPNLRALKLEQYHGLPAHHLRGLWNEPSFVPVCLSSSLETLEWVNYEGTEEEKEVVGFILRSGSCLNKVNISSKSSDCNKKLEMIKELTWFIRRSPTCQLAFD
ncbi:unnamed protein product [Eruca vesicaria subsp. sativa]|uniref:FBD domain-containing protein n=1 Tax=Eruca vesicaria subsp. sativa TaxID=29727 RepID=A0ABC8M5D6_ERUVS|nr:unnamed protein product [Eruca vesicaria subsp. sativa]